MAKIALNFEDGFTQFITSLPYETVADAAYREGINIPLDCADGACGTCKCKCKAGDFDPGDYIEEALSDEELEKGFALACQMIPESDLIIDVFASSTACKIEINSFQVTISQIEFLSDEIVKLKVKTKDDKRVNFLSGQYVNIEIPETDGQSRSYSFSVLPGSDSLEFLIRLIPDGLMSTYLQTIAKIGDQLLLKGPLGSFYLRKIERPTLFFAGGTGIAPLLSMLDKLVEESMDYPIKLYYGVTKDQNLVEIDRLEKIKTAIDFQYDCCISSEDSKQYAIGYVTQWIHKEELKELEYDIYLCGPNAMVEAVKFSLEEHDIKYTNFYTEKFLPSGILSKI